MIFFKKSIYKHHRSIPPALFLLKEALQEKNAIFLRVDIWLMSEAQNHVIQRQMLS